MKENNIQELQEIEVLQEEQHKVHKKQSKHGMKALVALTLAFALLIGSSFAYFTDYATESATGTAGTVAIALESDINLLDAEGRDILNPGDIRSGSFTVTNMGNKSADIRTTIALTAYDRDGNPIDLEGSNTTQSMYDLYLASDVEFIDGQGNIPKQGVQPLQTKNVNGNVITYSIPEYSLNGNSDLYDEVEVITNEGGISTYSWNIGFDFSVDVEEEVIPGESVKINTDYKRDCDFVLVFNTQAGNKWQGSVVQLDIIVEAKQHENTSAGWSLVEHQDLVVGSLSQGVVLPENVITTNGTINPGYEYTPSTSTSQSCTVKAQFIIDEGSYGDMGEKLIVNLQDAETRKETEKITADIAWDDSKSAYVANVELANVTPNTEYYFEMVTAYAEDSFAFTSPNAGETLVLTINFIY